MDLILGLVFFFGILYYIWQRRELGKFEVSRYHMTSRKVNSKIKLVVISDLHSFTYGKDNEELFRAVCNEKPDLILVPGDLIVSSQPENYGIALNLMKQLTPLAPVLFCNGNHESRVELFDSPCYREYCRYRRKLQRSGVELLNNKSKRFLLHGTPVCVSGLELPLSSYRKGRKPYLEPGYPREQLGGADSGSFQILLAHNPAFARQYALWGADLTVCGHYHGGLIRIPGIGSLVSPQLMPFPEFDAGEFTVGGRKIYVSRGLGTHTFHIRVFNRAELMSIAVEPAKG